MQMPYVAFTYNAEIWAFIEKRWNNPRFADYGTWDIMINELYDYQD